MAPMKKPSKAVVQKKRTIHMYAELWHASHCVLEAGFREPRGSSWQFLSSLVLTAFSFEAYLNHVGPRIIENWDGIERQPPLEKFNSLCKALDVDFSMGWAARPLQTIQELIEFRNTLAHGRTTEIESLPTLRDINDKIDTELGIRQNQDWERRIKTGAFAKRARDDVEYVLRRVQDARPTPKEALFTFGIGSYSATLVDIQ